MPTFRFGLILLLAFGSLGSMNRLDAQSYNTAFGLRIDNGINLTAQQRVYKNWTLEGIVHTSFRSDDLGLTVLGERHHKVLFRNLNFYYGAGGHYYWKNDRQTGDEEPEISENVYGLSLIGGAEISLGRINVGVDWKPELHLSNDEQTSPFAWNGAAISVRYIIDKRERKKVKDWKVWDKFEGKKKERKRLF
jgi:hypothetical protein